MERSTLHELDFVPFYGFLNEFIKESPWWYWWALVFPSASLWDIESASSQLVPRPWEMKSSNYIHSAFWIGWGHLAQTPQCLWKYSRQGCSLVLSRAKCAMDQARISGIQHLALDSPAIGMVPGQFSSWIGIITSVFSSKGKAVGD